MREPTKPAAKPASRAAAPPSRRGARATAPPPRREGSRARAIFSIIGLLVIFSILFGLVAISFDGLGGGTEDEDPLAQDPGSNLVPTYEARLRDNPNDTNTMLILANILQNRGEYPAAIAWYEKAVALKPEDVEARLAFGKALASYGQTFDAEAQYKRALEYNPRNAKAEYYLGELYDRSNPPRTEEAKAHYARASEIEPEGAWGRAARSALNRLNATPTPAGATPTP